MFHFDDDLEKYMVEIDGVAFACEEPREDYEEEARKLARLYGEKQQALDRKSTRLNSSHS